MIYINKLDDLKISRICFGGASISGEGAGYGFGAISIKDSVNLVQKSIDYGINIFDTAPIYGFGESENRLGLALKSNRDKAIIISKSGVDWHDNKRVNMTNSKETSLKQLENSLLRLNTDYIDIYMVHWPDKKVDIRETLEVYTKAQAQGKIRYIGLCNTNSSEIAKAREVCKPLVYQSEVNLFNDAISPLELQERELTMSWGTFDKGIISGSVKLDRKFDKDDCRSWAPWWKKSNWKDKVIKVEQLKKALDKKNISLVDFAINYNLTKVDTAICGFKSISQLDDIIMALENKIDASIISEVLKDARLN